MKKGRLEAFSDGVIAIIITIMVLELKVPLHDASWRALIPLKSTILSYILSFIYIGIYWNNHHHMVYLTEKINGKVLWANLNLLFWLSLIPFVTAWMGENDFAQWPVFFYGCVLICNALSYTLLSWLLVREAETNSALAQAIGKDVKGKISIVIYLCGIVLTFFNPMISMICYVAVAVIWFIPDRRIEREITGEEC